MRLVHITVENFRGISRLDLSFDRLTVVIGENNHGKSSLLDVLERCLGRPGGGIPTHFGPHDFRRTGSGPTEPIRIVMTFEYEADLERRPSSERILDVAMTEDEDGGRRLRVEFLGDVESGAMTARFIDSDGVSVEPEPPEIVLRKLREYHPVLLVRLTQPRDREPLAWPRAELADPSEETDDRALEDAIARVYRRLAEERGPVPTEELRRGLMAAHRLRERSSRPGGPAPGPLHALLDQLVDGPEAARPKGESHPPTTAGSGSHTLGILIVLGALLDVRGEATLSAEAHPIIAIEEPEAHLHPMVLASTWDVIDGLHAQTLVTTNSGEFLSEVPLHFLRRLVRRDGRIESHRLGAHTLSGDGLRRVRYHIRAKRGSALFARCWLLVEGETEFWLLRQLAHVLGYDLESEGVRCVEFAQCGVEPLVRLANDLGIEWYLLADGDEAGAAYAAEARRHVRSGTPRDHVTRLRRRSVELELWHHGLDDVYREAAGLTDEEERRGKRPPPPHRIIAKAVRRHSKPYLALSAAEACDTRGLDSIPGSLQKVLRTSVRLARQAVDPAPDAVGSVVHDEPLIGGLPDPRR